MSRYCAEHVFSTNFLLHVGLTYGLLALRCYLVYIGVCFMSATYDCIHVQRKFGLDYLDTYSNLCEFLVPYSSLNTC